MKGIQRTAQGAYLQTCQYLGVKPKFPDNALLNKVFNIQFGTELNTNDNVATQYFAISNKGHFSSMGANGIVINKAVPMLPRFTNMYNMVPFVLRTPSNDLSTLEKKKYRFFRLEEFNGVTYHAYYLKKFNVVSEDVVVKYRSNDTANNGVVFQPTIDDLYPTMPDMAVVKEIVTTGDYISASAPITFELNEEEIQEFINVCIIMFGSEEYATISKIGLVAGCDRVVSGVQNGVTVNYSEALSCVLTGSVPVLHPVYYDGKYVKTEIDVAAVEAMTAMTTL